MNKHKRKYIEKIKKPCYSKSTPISPLAPIFNKKSWIPTFLNPFPPPPPKKMKLHPLLMKGRFPQWKGVNNGVIILSNGFPKNTIPETLTRKQKDFDLLNIFSYPEMLNHVWTTYLNIKYQFVKQTVFPEERNLLSSILSWDNDNLVITLCNCYFCVIFHWCLFITPENIRKSDVSGDIKK